MSVVGSHIPATPLTDSNGNITFAWLKWFQNIANTVNEGFDPQGNYQGPIGSQATIVGRQYLATIVQHLTDAGMLSSDFVTDGAGNPITGGKDAYAALVASHPVLGQVLRFNGTVWLPSNDAQPIAKVPHEWLDSFDGTNFTQSQPGFADLSGSATAAQIPALSSLSGQISASQLPPSGLSVTITTAKLTGGGTNGSMTFTNGILTSQVQAT